MMMSWKEIKSDYLARVEGEAAFHVKVERNKVKEVLLNVYEPIRFFEAFIKGKRCEEVPEITSRICGICSAAHQITAVRAIESALGMETSEQTKDLRHLLAIGGMIQSHVLHLYFLAIPDYLGYESVVAMTKDHPEAVKRALKLKKLGNDLETLIGGRAIHAVTTAVGGFTALPDEEKLKKFGYRLKEARNDAIKTAEMFKNIKMPNFERKCEHIALRSEDGYPLNNGKLKSTEGLSCEENEYRKYIDEKYVPPSHAKHSTVKGRSSFLVGPLARMNLNFDKLSDDSKKIAEEIGAKFPNFNPFFNNVAKAIEILQYMDDAAEIINRIKLKREERKKIEAKPGRGYAITEAPRGILYHSYEIDRNCLVGASDIVTPTAHTVHNVEKDLFEFVPSLLDLPEEEATLSCEKLIRAYDPCFSCSVHLIKL